MLLLSGTIDNPLWNPLTPLPLCTLKVEQGSVKHASTYDVPLLLVFITFLVTGSYTASCAVITNGLFKIFWVSSAISGFLKIKGTSSLRQSLVLVPILIVVFVLDITILVILQTIYLPNILNVGVKVPTGKPINVVDSPPGNILCVILPIVIAKLAGAVLGSTSVILVELATVPQPGVKSTLYLIIVLISVITNCLADEKPFPDTRTV